MGWQTFDSAGSLITKPGLPTYVTSLPSTPADGTEVYYAADATNGVIWHLRYRSGSSSSYKWEFVGGGHLQMTSNTGTVDFTSTWTALNGSVTVPLAGDYDVGFGAMVYGDNGTLREFWLKVSASAPANTTDALMGYTNNTGPGRDQSFRTFRIKGVAASDVLYIWGQCTAGSTTKAEQRNIILTPVRVG